MVPASPIEALGSHAQDVQALVVRAATTRHALFAEAHEVSQSRYAMAFGSQWLDLLVDVREKLQARGYRTYKLPPAGYRLPVVNDCLVYVWRVPGTSDASASFASSPTRVNSFHAPPLDPTLFEPGFTGEAAQDDGETAELEDLVREANTVMPLVLVTVKSTPRQLQSVAWAVAELDEASGDIKMHGQESIWLPERTADAGVAAEVEPFDSGAPKGPSIEPREQRGDGPDA